MAQFDALETRRLHLQPLTEEVGRAILADNLTGLPRGEGWPHEDTKDGVALAVGHGHSTGWLIILDGQIIGDCGTHGPADGTGTIEIGYGLAAPYRGQGFGTEVVAAISNWLLSQPGTARVRAVILPTNAASRRVVEKCGFQMVTSPVGQDIYELAPQPDDG